MHRNILNRTESHTANNNGHEVVDKEVRTKFIVISWDDGASEGHLYSTHSDRNRD